MKQKVSKTHNLSFSDPQHHLNKKTKTGGKMRGKNNNKKQREAMEVT